MAKKDKKQTGGLDANNMPIGTDIGTSFISSIPELKNLQGTVDFSPKNLSDLSRQTDQIVQLDDAIYGNQYSFEEAPNLYKTNFKGRAGWNELATKVNEFKIMSAKDKAGKLMVKMAEYNKALDMVEKLYENLDITKQERDVLVTEIQEGNVFKQSEEFGLGEQLMNKILGLKFEDVSPEALQDFELSSYAQGLLSPEDQQRTTLDKKNTLEQLLEERASIQKEIEEREENIARRREDTDEDAALRYKLSEARGETSLGDIFGNNDYFEYQLMDDLAGMASTAEGQGIALASTAIAAGLKKFTAAGGSPQAALALTLAEIAGVSYGMYYSRAAETSMEAGEAYEQKINDLVQKKQQEVKNSGSDRELTDQEMDDIYIEASKGINELRDKNMMLGATDLLLFAITFGRVPAMGRWASTTKLGKLNRELRSTLPGRIGVNATRYSTAIALSRQLEGMEEGMQFRWMQDYLGDRNVGESGFLPNGAEAYKEIAEYYAMTSGLMQKDMLFNNPGFQNAVQSGKDMATVMTGTGRSFRGAADVYRARLAQHALGEDGAQLDSQENSRTKRNLLLKYIKSGRTKYLQDALYRLGKKGTVDGFGKEEAKQAIQEIDQLQSDYNKIFDKKSPLGISIAGIFEYDVLKKSTVSPYSQYDREFVFDNVSDIRNNQRTLEELEGQRSEFLSNKDELADFFAGDHLSDAVKDRVKKRLETRGLEVSPVDLIIEELKKEIANSKDANTKVATGEYTFIKNILPTGLYKKSDFDKLLEVDTAGKPIGGLIVDIAKLTQKRLAAITQQEGAAEFTAEDQALLDNLTKQKDAIEYEHSYEFAGKRRLKDQEKFSRAYAHDTIARVITAIENDQFEEILPTILKNNVKLDELTLRQVERRLKNIIARTEKDSSKYRALAEEIDNLKDQNAEMSEEDLSMLAELMKEKEQIGVSSNPELLQQLRDAKQKDKELKDKLEELTTTEQSLKNNSETAAQANNLLNRIQNDRGSHILKDSDFARMSEEELVLEVATADVANELSKIAEDLETNPDYANLDRISSLVNELQKRANIFDERYKKSESEQDKKLFEEVEKALRALLPQALSLENAIEENAVSRIGSQLELENTVVTKMLAPLGMDANFNIIGETGIFNIISNVVDLKDIQKVQSAVQEGRITDKVMAAQIILDLVKFGLKEQPSYKAEIKQDIKTQQKGLKNNISALLSSMSPRKFKSFKDNPINFKDIYLAFLGREQKDFKHPYFRYQDHLNEVKLLNELQETGLMPDMQELLRNQITYQSLQYLTEELDAELNAAANILLEKDLVDREAMEFKPTKQQLNAAREISSFLTSSISTLSKGKKGLGSISAYLQGAAGTGKTKIVLKLALKLAGLRKQEIYAIGHNSSSSATVNSALGLPKTTAEQLLSDTETLEGIKLLVIDEAPGLGLEQILAIQEKVLALNEQRESADKIRVVLSGDPAQIVPVDRAAERAAVDSALRSSRILEYIAKFITPVTALYRSDNPAIIDFQDLFRRKTDNPLDNIYNAKSTSVSLSTIDETMQSVTGVVGVTGNILDEILDRLVKLESVETGPRAIITNVNKVEELKRALEANNIKNTEVLSYIDAQGRTLQEAYIDIDPSEFTDEIGNLNAERYNKALYTATSRAEDLIVISRLNVVNSIDKYLNNLSTGLSEEITNRTTEYLKETSENKELLTEFPNLVSEVKPDEVQLPEETQEEAEQEFQEQIEDDNQSEFNEAEGDNAQMAQETEYEEGPYDTGGPSITYKPRKIDGVSRSDALYYPESEAFRPAKDPNGKVISTIFENGDVIFTKVEIEKQAGKTIYGISVLQQAYGVVDGQPNLKEPIPNVYRQVAVLGLDELDTGLVFLTNREREVLKAELSNNEPGALLSQYGDNQSVLYDTDQGEENLNLITGYRIPKGGLQQFKFKYKGQSRVRKEVRVQTPQQWMQNNKGMIDRIKKKFESGAYTKSQPPANPNKIDYSFRIFTTASLKNARQEYPGMSADTLSTVKLGRPYLIIDNAQIKGAGIKTYVIELRPRPLSPQIESDYNKYYKPVRDFIALAEQFEQLTGFQYGSQEFHNLVIFGNKGQKEMDQALTDRMSEQGRSSETPAALKVRDALLLQRFAEKNEAGEYEGTGPAQKAINALGKSNKSLRTMRKVKGKFVPTSRSLFSPLTGRASDKGKFTLPTLKNLFNDNVWNDGGTLINENVSGLFLPIPNFSLYKSFESIKKVVEEGLVDILEEVQPTKIIIEKGTKTNILPKPEKTKQQKETQQKTGEEIHPDELNEAIEGLEDLDLDYTDNNTGLKGAKISRADALKLLKRLMPDMFDSKGTLIPSTLALLNFVEMERMTGNELVLGRFNKGVIYLLEDKEGIYENVLRHEVLHKVIWNYLTPKERATLLKAARAKYNMPEGTFSNLQVEEKLAEEFMVYKAEPTSFIGAIGNFFKKVLKLLGFYQKNVDNIDSFFKNVESGYFSGKMYTESDVTGLNYIDIEKVFGTVELYRNTSKIFSKYMSDALDVNNKTANINKELQIVERPPLSRDEALKSTVRKANAAYKVYSSKKDMTAQEKRTLAALNLLGQEKISRILFKELYERDYKTIGLEIEELETTNLKEIIERAHEKDHSLSLSEEVVDFLAGLKYKNNQRINIKHGYYILLQLFAGLDSNLGIDAMQKELLRRAKRLGFKPGTAGDAVASKLTDVKNGLLRSALTNRLTAKKSIPTNARFISDSLFIYTEDTSFDIYDINYDIQDSGASRIVRQKGESSEQFFYRVWQALQNNGQDLNANQLKALYQKEISLKALKNIYVNAANLRKENFKVGKFSVSDDKRILQYYEHRSFGADATHSNTVTDAISVNVKKLTDAKIASIKQKLSGDVEGAIKELLNTVGYDLNLVSLDLRNQDTLKVGIEQLLNSIQSRLGVEVDQIDDSNLDKDGNAEVIGKTKTTIEEILDDERSTLRALGKALQFIGQGQKPQSIKTVEGKTLYTYHNSSFGVDALLGLRPSVKVNNRKEYLKKGSAAYEHTYQYNIFVNGDSKVYNISDHDGIISESGFGKPVIYRREEEGRWSDRVFNYMFLAGMSQVVQGVYKYTQQLNTVADAPNLKAAEVRVLMPDQVDNAILKIVQQYNSKPLKSSLAFNKILSSKKKTDSQKVKEIKAEIIKRAKNFEEDLKSNNVVYDSNVMDKFIRTLKTLGHLDKKIEVEKARSKVIELFQFNYAINSFFLNQITMGDQAQFGSSVKAIKRNKIAFAPGHKGFVNDRYGMKKNFRVIVANDPVATPFDYLTPAELKALRDDMEAILGTDFENFDMADAQGFILPERLADIRKGFGGGIKISTVLKPVYFGVNEDGKTDALKYSAVVLSDDLIKRHPLFEKIRNEMRAVNADELVFKTANKVGGPKVLGGNGYVNNKVPADGQFTEDLSFTEDNIITLDNSNYRIQLDPKSGLNKLVASPTQLAYFIDSNGLNAEEAAEYYNLMGEEFTEGAYEFFNSLNTIGKGSKKILSRPIPKQIKSTRHKTRSVARDSAAKLESSQKEAEILSTRNKDTNEFAIGPNFPGVANKVFSLMLSNLRSQAIKLKLPGYKMVLQSAYGVSVYEENGVAKTKEDIVDFETKLAAGKIKPRALKHITIDKPYVEVLMPSVHQDKFRIGDQVFDDRMLGFRIPSTELHSAVSLKIVGFYDAFETNVIILPKELTPLHGSDFDVDSLFVLRKATMFDKKNGKDLYANGERGFEYKGNLILGFEDGIRYDYINLIEAMYEEATADYAAVEQQLKLQTTPESIKEHNDALTSINQDRDMAKKIMSAMRKNRMVDVYLGVIEDKKNRKSMMTPIDMNNFKGVNRKLANGEKLPSVFDVLSDALKVKIQPNHKQLEKQIDLTDPLGERYMHQSNKSGTILTGVFANNMKVLIYSFKGSNDKVYFGDKDNRLSYEIDDTEYSELRRYAKGTDVTGRPVDEYVYGTLDSAVNAAIDNANEQILNIANMSGATANLFTMMVAQGVPLNKVALFLNQPIIRIASKRIGNMSGNLNTLQQEIMEDLGINEGKMEIILDKIKLTTKNLTAGVSRSDILKDVSIKTQLGQKKDLLVQLKVLQLAKEINKYESALLDMSSALSILQTVPSTLAEFEQLKKSINKIIEVDKEGNLGFNKNFPLQVPDLLENLPHFKAAYNLIAAFDTYASNTFHLANDQLKAFASSISNMFTTDKETKETAAEKDVKVRTELVKYIATSMPQFSLLTEKEYVFKGNRGERVYTGAEAFVKRTADKIKSLPKASRFNNKFLASLELRRDSSRAVTGIKFNGANDLTQADLIDLYSDFEKIDVELKEDLIKYAVVVEGLSFGGGNISMVINPQYFAEVEKDRVKLMDKIFPRNEVTEQSVEGKRAERFQNNIKDHFLIQFALNNLGNVQEMFSKKLNADVIAEKPDSKTKILKTSRKVKDGKYYHVKLQGESLPQFVKSGKFNILYYKIFEEGDEARTGYYQEVGRANKGTSIYSADLTTLNEGYSISKAFSPQLPVIAVNNLSDSKFRIPKHYGLKPGMTIGIRQASDYSRANVVTATISKIEKDGNYIFVSLDKERTMLNVMTAQDRMAKDNVKLSKDCN